MIVSDGYVVATPVGQFSQTPPLVSDGYIAATPVGQFSQTPDKEQVSANTAVQARRLANPRPFRIPVARALFPSVDRIGDTETHVEIPTARTWQILNDRFHLGFNGDSLQRVNDAMKSALKSLPEAKKTNQWIKGSENLIASPKNEIYLLRELLTGAQKTGQFKALLVASSSYCPPMSFHVINLSPNSSEVEICEALDGKSVQNVCQTKQVGDALVTAFKPGGSLEELLDNRGSLLSLSEKKELSLGVIRGLEELHGRGIVHRDLKPANIVLNNEDRPGAYICDFGSSERTDHPKTENQIPYMLSAPEVLMGTDPCDLKQADLYCLGVVLFCIFAGTPWATLRGSSPFLYGMPFPKEEKERVEFILTFIAERANVSKWPNYIALHNPVRYIALLNPVRDLILALLDKDPLKRPSLEVVAKVISQIRLPAKAARIAA